MTDRLSGKVAVVFGAGGPPGEWSNGKAAAVAYAREGAIVVAIDRITEAAEDAAQVIQSEGGQALALTADVTNTESVNLAVQTADGKVRQDRHPSQQCRRCDPWRTYGNRRCQSAAEHGSQRWLAASHGARCSAAFPRTGQRFDREHLVPVGDSLERVLVLWYYASKAAVNHATVAIALQYADKGIRANVIMPGVIDTPLVYKQIAGQYKTVEEMKLARSSAVPMKRTGSPWDIANAAVFLASDEARFITGVCLPVDGGHSCVMPGLV